MTSRERTLSTRRARLSEAAVMAVVSTSGRSSPVGMFFTTRYVARRVPALSKTTAMVGEPACATILCSGREKITGSYVCPIDRREDKEDGDPGRGEDRPRRGRGPQVPCRGDPREKPRGVQEGDGEGRRPAPRHPAHRRLPPECRAPGHGPARGREEPGAGPGRRDPGRGPVPRLVEGGRGADRGDRGPPHRRRRDGPHPLQLRGRPLLHPHGGAAG